MSSYSEGQVHQLANALENANFTSADITKLIQFRELSEIKKVSYGYSKIVPVKYVVDCDADPLIPDPLIPDGWEVEKHKKGGQIEFDPGTIELYLSEKQKEDSVKGDDLRKELERKPVLNTNILEYLLKHPEIIPEEWKGKYIFFWGTIFRDSDGRLSVRYLRWRGGQWGWRHYWLDSGWYANDPAALLAK